METLGRRLRIRQEDDAGTLEICVPAIKTIRALRQGGL